MSDAVCEIDRKRTSTSSQTTDEESDKILYTKPITQIHTNKKEKYTAHIKSFKLNFENFDITQFKPLTTCKFPENFSKLKRFSASPRNKKNPLHDNLPILNKHQKPAQFQPTISPKLLNLVLETNLIPHPLPKPIKTKQLNSPFHKTYYSIFPEITQTLK